jgi:hypothetical protein
MLTAILNIKFLPEVIYLINNKRITLLWRLICLLLFVMHVFRTWLILSNYNQEMFGFGRITYIESQLNVYILSVCKHFLFCHSITHILSNTLYLK